ncbi:MAG: hypothetical protein CMJ40_00880 [Phycisphaerae bacterium]|nr:hypothetical protein [Phycisphaerae bacterium]|tara:strand:+ start:1420 stop:2172 length:753 start_codon:yes stop_codon:yes gene_type:complete
MSLIEDLLELNLVERQLRGLQSRVGSAETFFNAQNRQMNELLQRKEELQTRRKQRQVAVSGFETDTKAMDERLEKLRNELNTAETTKQYSAFLEEMNTLKQTRGETDELALAEMSEIESIDEDMGTLEEAITERQTVLTRAATELEERKAEIAERVTELQRERDVKAAIIPESPLSTFTQCADDFDGDAMAHIEEIDKKRREYCCSSCNVNLPFNIVVQLLGNIESLTQCENCLRILYVTPELKAETIAK